MIIHEKFPRGQYNKYNINGEVISKYKIDHFDQNRFNEVGDFAEIEESYEESNSHIEKYISHIQYDYLPHFLLPYNNEEINKEEIFYAMIEKDDETIGHCLISLPLSHPLYPKEQNEEFFDDVKWIISSSPLIFDFFYEEGLINY